MDMNNAQELFDNGKYSELITLLSKTSNADEQQLLAYSYQKTGKFEEAMNCWNELIQKLPEVAQFYNERGVCKFNLRFKHALEDFNKAVELEADNPYFYSCRAYVKDKIGDSEGAVEDYEKAYKLDPTDAITLNNLGLAEQKLGHTAKAREFFKKSDSIMGIDMQYDELPSKLKSNKEPVKPSLKNKLREVKRMLSSSAEFKKFLKEVMGKS